MDYNQSQITDEVINSMYKYEEIPMFEFEAGTSVWQTQKELLDGEGGEPFATEQELEKEREKAKKSSLEERSYNALILRTFPPLVRYAGARFETSKGGWMIRLDAPNYIDPSLSAKEQRAEYRWWKRESKKLLAKRAKSEKKQEEWNEKIRNKEYEELGSRKVMKDGKEVKEQRLVDSHYVRGLFLGTSKEAREKWASARMGRTNLTRREIIQQVGKGDYSNYENLDDTMRNMFAKEALDRMVERYTPKGESIFDCKPEAICARILEEGGVKALLDAPLRLGLSLSQRENEFYKEDSQKNWFRRLDEQMSAAVMLETLKQKNFKELTSQISGELGNQGMNKYDADMTALDMVKADKAQKIQVAKRLLLMHMGRFTQVKNKEGEQVDWDKPVAVALSHCSRVTLTMPKCGETREDKEIYKEMWNRIFYQQGGEGGFTSNLAQDKRRAASTHSIKVRRNSIKEKKVPFNLRGQRGMDVAIGGLGNAGVSGKMLLNNGSCGHFYSMYKAGDTKHFGAILMGLESDRPGVTNQLGHTHDARATAEKASSLGGQRTDEVGMKYGGRRCDLSNEDPGEIAECMYMLELAMKRNAPGFDEVLEMLVGKPSDDFALEDLKEKISYYAFLR